MPLKQGRKCGKKLSRRGTVKLLDCCVIMLCCGIAAVIPDEAKSIYAAVPFKNGMNNTGLSIAA